MWVLSNRRCRCFRLFLEEITELTVERQQVQTSDKGASSLTALHMQQHPKGTGGILSNLQLECSQSQMFTATEFSFLSPCVG